VVRKFGLGHFEVDFDGVDQGHEPGEKFLVDGVRAVIVQRGAVSEFHHAAEFVALAAGGDIFPDEGFEQSGDLSLHSGDFRGDALFLFCGDVGAPAKRKHVDEHKSGISPPKERDEFYSNLPAEDACL
jgi:hypothetical protein